MRKGITAALLLCAVLPLVSSGGSIAIGENGLDNGNVSVPSGGSMLAYGSYSSLRFYAPLNSSGLSQLDRTLTVGSTTLSPSLWCEGQDATTSDLACDVGGTLSIAGAGADVTPSQPSPFTDGTRSVKFNGGKTFSGSLALGTQDLVAIVTGNPISENAYVLLIGTTSLGVRIRQSGTGFYLNIDNGGASDNIYCGVASGQTSAMFFIDRNGYARCIPNGLLGSAVDVSANAGDLSATAILIGGNSGFNMTSALTELVVYECDDCLPAYDADSDADGVTDWQEIAQDRFARLTGTKAEVNKAGSTLPTFIRATSATLDMYDPATSATYLHTVAAGWPRVASSEDAIGTQRYKYLAEPAATNKALQSADMTTSWAKTNAGDTVAADTITADATDTAHGVTQAITLTAASYTMSAFMKAGDETWGYLQDATATAAYSHFDLSDCTTGTKGAGASAARAIDYGDGWCRIAITYTGTAAAHTHEVACAHADTDIDFVGDGTTVSCSVRAVQVELGVLATSYVATTTAAVTRNADVLAYSVTGPAKSALSATVLCPSYDAPAYTWIASLSDGTSSNYSGLYLDATDVSGVYVTADGTPTVDELGTSDIYSNTLFALRGWFSPALIRLYVDATQEGSDDTSATVPTTTTLYMGGYAGGSQSGCLISDVQVYKALTMRAQ